MKIKKLSPRERKLVIFGGLAAVIIVGVTLGIVPFLDQKRQLKKKIEDQRARLEQHIKISQEEDSLLAKKADLNQRLDKANAKLLNQTVPSEAVNQLQTIADGLLKTVEIQTRRPGKEERLKEDYQRISTQMDFQCQIDQLVPALYEIRNYDKNFLSLDALEITYQQYAVKAKDSKMKPLRVSLTLSTIIRYIAPEKKDDKEPGRGKPATGPVKA